MQFKVELAQTIIERCTVYCEADSEIEAEGYAETKAMEGQVEWRFADTQGGIDIISIERLETI